MSERDYNYVVSQRSLTSTAKDTDDKKREQEWLENEKKRKEELFKQEQEDDKFSTIKKTASTIYVIASLVACIVNICLADSYEQEWTGWVISALILITMIIFLIARSYSKDLSDIRRERKHTEEVERDSVKVGVSKLHNDLIKKYGKDYLYVIADAPPTDFVDANLLPHSSKNSLTDKYTFYIGSLLPTSSSKYHTAGCKYAIHSSAHNAYYIKKTSWEPCAICRPKLPDTEWVNKYRSNYYFMTKYLYVSVNRTDENT